MVKPEVRSRLSKSCDVAAQGIKNALTFLKDLGVTSDRLLPYGLQLVLLGEFFRLCPQPSASAVELLKRWFWVTSFTGWLAESTPRKRLALWAKSANLAKGTGAEFRVIDLDTPAQPFPERFDGRSARVRAFLLYLASLRPRSFRDMKNLDPGQLLATRGTRAVGYVFSNPGTLGEPLQQPREPHVPRHRTVRSGVQRSGQLA